MEAVTTSSRSFLGFPSNPTTAIGAYRTKPSSFTRRSHLSYSSALSHDRVFLQFQRAANPRKEVSTRRMKCLECRGSSVLEADEVPRKKKKKLAVFVSGGGSNFRSIHEAVIGGSVCGDVVVLVTDKSGCGGAQYARENGIPVILFPKTKSSPEGLSSTELVASLKKFEVDFLLLAGYLKLIPVELVRAYPRCIINIHPSLLPAFGGKGFYGLNVHKAVIASGARYSGPTIHFVDEQYDTGRILAQRVVPVLANDTAEQLASRVLHEEHRLYVEVVEALCEERIIWREDGVPLIRGRTNPAEYS